MRINRTAEDGICRLDKSGFTLVELLIVVAIVAVLTGVAIPVFTSQLERSRQATDLANLRSAYADATVQAITSDNEIGRVTTGPMKHTGGFTKIDGAMIGQFSANGCGVDKIIKDYPVTLVYNAGTNSLNLEFAWNDGSVGSSALKSDIEAKVVNTFNGTVTIGNVDNYDYNPVVINANSRYGERRLHLTYMNDVVNDKGEKATEVKMENIIGEYGVVTGEVYKVDSIINHKHSEDNIETVHHYENYFKWDGKGWLMAINNTNAGDDSKLWVKVGSYSNSNGY